MEIEPRILTWVDWNFVKLGYNFVIQGEDGSCWGSKKPPVVKEDTWVVSDMKKDQLWSPTEMWYISDFNNRTVYPLQGLFSDWGDSLYQLKENEWVAMQSNGQWNWYYLEPNHLNKGFFPNKFGSSHPISVIENWQEKLFVRPGFQGLELA